MFIHLHVHSWFSLGFGVSSPEALVEAAAARGFTALACTDLNGVYGAVEFQQAALARGIRPILGAHLVAGGEEVVALVVDEPGWGALCRAITAIHWGSPHCGSGAAAGDAARDACSLSTLLAADREGLLLLSRDAGFLERVIRLSGPRDLYAELRPGKERHAVAAAARRLGIPAVVTGGVMFAHPEDWPRHRLRVAIARNAGMSALRDAGREDPSPHPSLRAPEPSPLVLPASPGAWLRPAADLARHFPDCPEALDRAGELADRCRYRIPVGERVIVPRDEASRNPDDALARLRALAYQGATRRYGVVAPVTRDRLEHELAIIGQKRFAEYFLVVHDIVRHGPTHCGRGSVANSIVSYCLGITHVDPLGAGLLFERFLNPERRDPPDIDLDFPWDERDAVLAYVFRKYPHPRSAMVATHNCFRLRGALREVAKVHGRPPGEIREITRRFPWFLEEASIADLLAKHPNFRGLHLPEIWRELAALAQSLVGAPRHLSVHPGGVVIVPDALTNYVPVERAAKQLSEDGGTERPDVPVIQFEKDGAEDTGLAKIDLLGNRSLAVIRDTIAAVRANTGGAIDDTTSDPEDDEPTRALFRTGRTMGIFYTESPASRLLCAKSRADTFELLVLNTSIIRPASNRFIRLYLERLHGTPYEPLDPSLRDTLAETFGIMVYQEDVVNVCATFAGMPLATADGLRKALSKKRPLKQLAAYAEEFFAGAAALGRDPETAKRVWEMVMSFAGYSFCKGHSCSYIRVAQQACYLRAHYPAEFMAAVLANGGGFYAPFAYVAEARRMGLTVLPPDVNASDRHTTGRGREVRIGLQFIKGLSDDGVERIVQGRGGAPRAAGGEPGDPAPGRPQAAPGTPRPAHPYTSLPDLWSRTGLAAEDLRLLIKVGACDSIANGWTRPMMLWWIDQVLSATRGGRASSTQELWDSSPARRDPGMFRQPPALREYPPDRRRREECALLGFATDVHPMQLHAAALRRFRIVRSTDLPRHVGRSVLCAGLLTTAKPVRTVHDEPMEFVTFDDGDGLIEAVLFPEVYRTRGHILFDEGPFLFRGKVEEEFGAVTLTVTHLDRLERVGEQAPSPEWRG